MSDARTPTRASWNLGRIVGPKPPPKPKHIRAIRTRMRHDGRVRDLAMFNTAIAGKLRGCDLVKLRVSDIQLGDSVRLRATVIQQKTGRPVPFELTDPTGDAVAAWLKKHSLRRTKLALVHKRTGNLRACQLLLRHTKLESTVRYLGIEGDDALGLVGADRSARKAAAAPCRRERRTWGGS